MHFARSKLIFFRGKLECAVFSGWAPKQTSRNWKICKFRSGRSQKTWAHEVEGSTSRFGDRCTVAGSTMLLVVPIWYKPPTATDRLRCSPGELHAALLRPNGFSTKKSLLKVSIWDFRCMLGDLALFQPGREFWIRELLTIGRGILNAIDLCSV